MGYEAGGLSAGTVRIWGLGFMLQGLGLGGLDLQGLGEGREEFGGEGLALGDSTNHHAEHLLEAGKREGLGCIGISTVIYLNPTIRWVNLFEVPQSFALLECGFP